MKWRYDTDNSKVASDALFSAMSYRIEVSPNNREKKKNAECKKDKVKLLKGELRFGTFVTIMEHQSWQWKHWSDLPQHDT